MKIIKIREHENRIYSVKIKPNLIMRVFGAKEKTLRFKDTGRVYTFGGQTVYVNEKGERIDKYSKITKAIDCHMRSF